MEVMISEKKKMSELTDDLVIYPQKLVNIRVKNKAEARNDADVQKKLKEVSEKISDSGRILLRESGTEPVVRVMAEAETIELCEQYVNEVADMIRSKGYEVK